MNGPERQAVLTDGAPKPVFSYSQGVLCGGLLFVSGQVPIDPASGQVPEGFPAQVRQTLANVDAIAKAAGTELKNAVRVGVYLDAGGDFDVMDKIYREHFGDPLPARTTLGAGLRGFTIEVDAIIALAGK